MNSFVGFKASFTLPRGAAPELRIAGSSFYRIRLNGETVGYGPARAAKGFFRVDVWPLAAAAREGGNLLTIEASAYNVNTFCASDQPGFIQAEIVLDGEAIAATAAGGDGGFTAVRLPRVTKCSRYSFQRGFGEAYRVDASWGTFGGAPLPLAEQPGKRLIGRIAPLPDMSVNNGFKPVKRTIVECAGEVADYYPLRFIDNLSETFKAYPATELEINLSRELQRFKVTDDSAAPAGGGAPFAISGGRGIVFDAGLDDTGFAGLTVRCTKPGRLWLAFDELLYDGQVMPLRYGVVNGAVWDIAAPGTYSIESFETYTFRYVHVFMEGGETEISAPWLRGFKNAGARGARFGASDPDLVRIFDAARETFAQNAVDVFTDCPGRERAGWLCDSFFTARSSLLFTGSTDLETLFLQNFLIAEKFDALPDGMLPMCYPADHPDGRFIPNWAMWFVLELREYAARGGDRGLVDALRPRLLALVRFLETFENADGLLERLPSWVFIEWSKANELVKDVSYPSNMTWAEMLDCMDRLYGLPELREKAGRVRAKIREQSWNGTWFCDNALRRPDGSLAPSGECSETCQYYAFYMHVASPETHPALWTTLLEDFGPRRVQTGKFPEIYPSNAFIGNFLRLDLLGRAGLGDQILRETKGYFGKMADMTGTLWENDTPCASCNHGFASHAAVFYVRDVLGVKSVDIAGKTVTLADTDAAIDFCEATLPVADGAIVVTRRMAGGRPVHDCRLPAGWRAVRAGL